MSSVTTVVRSSGTSDGANSPVDPRDMSGMAVNGGNFFPLQMNKLWEDLGAGWLRLILR